MNPFLFLIAGLGLSLFGSDAEARSRAASFSAAQVASQVSEVEATLARIARSGGFFELSKKDQATALLKGGLRASVFSLQSLGRVYEDYPIAATNDFFVGLRVDAKRLEDTIGEFDLLKSLGRKGAAEKAAHEMMELIAADRWLDRAARCPRCVAVKNGVSKLSWLAPAEDRAFVIGKLVTQLQIVKDADYDMRKLEEGLHELRRELRWFSISAKSLGGLVIASQAVPCPQRAALFSEHSDSKYALGTRGPFPNACRISACLSTELNGAVGLFGKLKDEAELITEDDTELKRADRTPPKVAAQAAKAYKALLRSGILENTQAQLRECVR